MSETQHLTRDIGQAERAMRALLEAQLREADLAFPEWTVLVHLDGAGPLTAAQLVQRQLAGRVVAEESAARGTVDRLRSAGLLGPVGEGDGTDGGARDGATSQLAPTEAGGAVYRRLRRAVSRITDELYGDLPPADLEATQRTLTELTRRANARLTDSTS